MKRHLVNTVGALTVVAVCFAGTAFATQSRINSMGGGVKQITVLDERNIFALPAELVKWGTWTGLEIGAPGYTSFGIHYNFNPTTVLAIYGSSQKLDAITLGTQQLVNAQANSAISSSNFNENGETHKITAIFGIDFGSTRLGVLLGIWGDRDKVFDDGGQEELNVGPLVLEVGLGLGFAVGAGDLDLGLDFKYRAPTDIGADGEVLSNNSQIDIGILARGTFPFSGPHELVPFLGIDLAFSSGQLTSDGSPQLSGLSYNIMLGTDIRLNLGDGIVVQPGIGLRFADTSVTTTPDDGDITKSSSTFAIPFYNVAVDVQVTEWLDIRFGGGQEVLFLVAEKFTEGSSDGGTSASDVRHHIATGVGFNLPAGVSIDIEVNTEWWKQGPYFISGHSGNFGMNAALSKDW